MIILKGAKIYPEDVHKCFKKCSVKQSLLNFFIGILGLIWPMSLFLFGDIQLYGADIVTIFGCILLLAASISFSFIYFRKSFLHISKSNRISVNYYSKSGTITVKCISRGTNESPLYYIYLDDSLLSFQDSVSSCSCRKLDNKKVTVYFLKETKEVFLINVLYQYKPQD